MIRRKFRDNSNTLVGASRPQCKRSKGELPREFRIVSGNSFRKSINLYWIKRKYDKKKYKK